MDGGQWTDQKLQVDPIPIPPLPFEEVRSTEGENHQARHQRVREPQLDAQAAMRSGTYKRAQAHSEPLRMEQRDWTEGQKR